MLATPRSYTWGLSAFRQAGGCEVGAYQFSRFSTSYREFQIRVFLPVSKEEGKFGKESVVNVSSCSN